MECLCGMGEGRQVSFLSSLLSRGSEKVLFEGYSRPQLDEWQNFGTPISALITRSKRVPIMCGFLASLE